METANLTLDALVKAKTYYQSCINTTALEANALPSLIALLKELGKV